MAVLGILLLPADERLIELPAEQDNGEEAACQTVQKNGAKILSTSKDDLCEWGTGGDVDEVDGPPAGRLIWNGDEWMRHDDDDQQKGFLDGMSFFICEIRYSFLVDSDFQK